MDVCFVEEYQYFCACGCGFTCAGSCFVKYATVDEAERAIRSLNNQYTFPGVSYSASWINKTKPLCAVVCVFDLHIFFFQEHAPLTVKYADRERERLGGCSFWHCLTFTFSINSAFLHFIQLLLLHWTPWNDFKYKTCFWVLIVIMFLGMYLSTYGICTDALALSCMMLLVFHLSTFFLQIYEPSALFFSLSIVTQYFCQNSLGVCVTYQ